MTGNSRQSAYYLFLAQAVIKEKYGIDACNVGDEGGFAPNISRQEILPTLPTQT